MKTPSTAPKRLPGRMAARAFTLTELLVVLLIISTLMGMLAPSVAKAIRIVGRRACAANESTIVRAAGQYALNDRRKCLPTVFTYNKTTLSGTRQGYDSWGNMTKGNPGCLWLLVKEGQLDRSVFLCPEAETDRRWIAPPLDANHFTYVPVSTANVVDVSTLSYSWISMTYHVGTGGWKTDPTPPAIASSDQLADQMSMDMVPSTLVVLADQNPRCTLGTQTIISYDDINAANGGKLTMKARKNSTNHNREGQNITRWDGSASWVLDPNDQSGNDVYKSSHKDTAMEKEGRRKDMADPFVLP